ncbi:MAG: glycosyltransferase [Nitrospinota bacterium]
MDISVILPVVERYDNFEKLYREFASEFSGLGKSFEFIFVVDGSFEAAFEELKRIRENNPGIKIIKLTKDFGESTPHSVGFEKSNGEYIFTLASYFQVDASAVGEIWKEIGMGTDLVVTRRFPRTDSKVNQIQSYVYHWLIRKIIALRFHDISCGLKGMKRKVFEEIRLYGDLHRFIPVLAHNQGFKIKEIKAAQRKEDTALRLVRPGAYARRVLDILTIFFITKFTMKPLRFFGLIGMVLATLGGSITCYLGVYRILGLGPIADRPFLLLGVLLMVLGVQTVSIGLLGEIIIFTHAREVKEYNVSEFLE